MNEKLNQQNNDPNQPNTYEIEQTLEYGSLRDVATPPLFDHHYHSDHTDTDLKNDNYIIQEMKNKANLKVTIQKINKLNDEIKTLHSEYSITSNDSLLISKNNMSYKYKEHLSNFTKNDHKEIERLLYLCNISNLENQPSKEFNKKNNDILNNNNNHKRNKYTYKLSNLSIMKEREIIFSRLIDVGLSNTLSTTSKLNNTGYNNTNNTSENDDSYNTKYGFLNSWKRWLLIKYCIISSFIYKINKFAFSFFMYGYVAGKLKEKIESLA